ncbi:MAG: protein-tyrosine phosphatase [Fusobacteria bacterium]|nr:MAG: protein-tyrosine phosphatase [Fusobacteriota bacterium]KAF0229243.1 MAG: protein-tyrosine [Fusobacteriota bacterium]
MVDVHSHLLPLVDDGAIDIDDMNGMLDIYLGEGVDSIVATPHFKSGIYMNSYEKVCLCIDVLGLSGRVLPGQEVFLDKDTLGYCKEGLIRGINGGSYLLVELAFDKFRVDYLSYVIELIDFGFRVVIAHPERYAYFSKNPSLLDDFIRVGCFFQINSGSFLGLFGKDVKDFAFLLARSGLVDFVGSDAHGSVKRVPRLKVALQILDKAKAGLGSIVESNAKSLVLDELLVVQKRKPLADKRKSVKLGAFKFFK